MNLLAKTYLYVLFLAVCVFLLWTLHTITFAENANQTFEVWLFMPSWRGEAMGTSVRYPMSLPLLLAGWATVGCGICFLAWRLPARIRRSASTQRELRALRREVLKLRTLPLRQREEDEQLAREAQLALGRGTVLADLDGAPGNGEAPR